MKMLNDHYNDLRDSMRRRLDISPYLPAAYEQAGLSAERFRWDLARASIGDKGICALYKYLNDNHIDTALRAVIAELTA